MSKPIKNIEESLSVAYSTAVLAHSGYSVDYVDEDYGTDISVRNIKKFNNKYIDIGTIFDCQLKATVNWKIENELVIYDMKAEAFNRLVFRNKNSSIPIILVLLCLPKSQNEWLDITKEELMIKNCCYYYYINSEETSNKEQIRIKIPIKNKFHPNEIKILVEQINSGNLSI